MARCQMKAVLLPAQRDSKRFQSGRAESRISSSTEDKER